MERLRRRFDKFHRDHRPRTRISDMLRAAALAALDGGAAELDVRCACKATSVQLVQWQRRLQPGAEVSGPGEHEACVFQVVDQEPEIDIAPKRTGCSGQIYSDTEVFTTCEYLPHYACYDMATCGVTSVGRCGWITNPAFDACVARSLSN